MRVYLLVIIFLLVPVVAALPHEQHPSFSSSEQRITINNNQLDISDDAIYNTAYYSVNGTSWQSVTLVGTSYENSNDWLTTAATSLPSALSNLGEHYLLFYSCSWDADWDCHGRNQEENGYWQLRIINNTDVQDEESGNNTVEPPLMTENMFAEDNLYSYDAACGVCDIGFSCVAGVCEYDGLGHVFYVALGGDDAGPGTISEPWETLQHAITQAEPGDTVYIRGGEYHPTNGITWDIGNSLGNAGTADGWIRFLNYPGERPIFDFSNVDIYDGFYNNGFSMNHLEYVHLRGMTVRNVYQRPFSVADNRSGEAGGVACSPCANMIYENMVAHDIDGRAFQHWTGAWNDFDAQDAVDKGYQDTALEPVFEDDTTLFINSDAYNLYDVHSDSPGNAADGWKVETYYGNHFTWEGCRAWNYSDDGFNPHGSGTQIFNNNWAMSTDKYEGVAENWAAEGNGFKTSGSYLVDTPDDEHMAFFTNNIAAFCLGTGFIANLGTNYFEADMYPANTVFYNNFAYQNGVGIGDAWYDPDMPLAGLPRTSIYRNNVAYDSTSDTYEVSINNPPLDVGDTNTWIGDMSGWPSWLYNPDFSVTDDDFVSLSLAQLTAPRRSDFTLPDTDFGRPVASSDLVDAGVDVGLPYEGSAPDIGALEYGYEPEVVCRGPSVRQCPSGDGIGEQKRSCIDPGQWSNWGTCGFVSCNDGYVLEDDVCVIGTGWSRELVFNGGFEGSLDGWTFSPTTWDVVQEQSWGAIHYAQAGSYSAYIPTGSTTEGYLYQDVSLADVATHIDVGNVVANISGWGISPPVGASLTAIKFMLLDENKDVITTLVDTGYVDNSEWWQAIVTEEPLPVGTRYIRVWGNSHDMWHYHDMGGDLDSFSVKINVLDS